MKRVPRKVSPQRRLEKMPRPIQECMAIQSAKRIQSAPPERSFCNSKVPTLQPLKDATHEFDRLKFIELFDKMIELCLSESVHIGFERIFPEFFTNLRDVEVTWWENIPHQSRYISRRMNCQMPSKNFDCIRQHPDSIFHRKENASFLLFLQPETHETESNERHLFYFPLAFATHEVFGVVELSVTGYLHETEVDIIRQIQARFVRYAGNVFYSHQRVSLASRVVVVDHLDHTIPLIKSKIKEIFSSKIIELWYLEPQEEQYHKWDDYSNEFICVYRCNTGIAGAALRSNRCVNESVAQRHPNYVTEVDIEGLAPILVATCIYDSKTWAIVLRGERSPYSNAEVRILTAMMMFIASSIMHSVTQVMDEYNALVRSHERLTSGMNVGYRLSRVTDVSCLITEIREQFRTYCSADVCHMLVLGGAKQFSSGQRTFPVDNGIAGACVSASDIIRVVNPSLDGRFRPDVDLGNAKMSVIGCIMAVPICSPENEVLAVVNLAWKKSSEAVPESEEKHVKSIAWFSGICLAGVMQRRDTVVTANTMARLIGQPGSLTETMTGIKETLGASRVTLLLVERQCNTLYELMNVGDSSEGVTEAAEEAMKFNKIVVNKDVFYVPIPGEGESVQGIMEIVASMGVDFGVLECASLVLSDRLKDPDVQAKIGIEEEVINLRRVIGQQELMSTITPKTLMHTDDSVFELAFDSGILDTEDLIRCIFMIFDKFSLKKEFSITNQTMFLFLRSIAHLYNETNWKRAVDTLQFLSYELSVSGLSSALSKMDIIAIFMVSLCHNIEQNVYSDPRLSLINPDSSTMHACECALTILSKQHSNIFGSLDSRTQQHLLKDVIRLMIQSRRFNSLTLMQKYEEEKQRGDFDITKNCENRELVMLILLKIADFGTLCRPFDIANRATRLLRDDGFMESAYHAMITALAQSYEPLAAAQKQFEENLDHWK